MAGLMTLEFNNFISVDCKIQIFIKEIIIKTIELIKCFNFHYINIVKNTKGKIPIRTGSSTSNNDLPEVIKEVIEIYKP